jgi:beta-1,4-N-acetylglucosaminyltransferase
MSKAIQFEHMLSDKHLGKEKNDGGTSKELSDFEIVTVPRARKIHQPLYTTPFSSVLCLWACILLLTRRTITFPATGRKYQTSPDMILTNGPATGVIVILASLIVRFLGLQRGGEMRTIYVESWARVRSLSLSGKILLWGGLTDRFLVQWENLKGGRAEWRGFLVE